MIPKAGLSFRVGEVYKQEIKGPVKRLTYDAMQGPCHATRDLLPSRRGYRGYVAWVW